MDYGFGPAHTVEAFQAQADDMQSRTGWDFHSAVGQACGEAREACLVRHPFEDRYVLVEGFEPQGCPLDVLAEALYLDAWDCWLFTDEAAEALSTSAHL